jgi:hypothetical protein
MRIIFSRKGFDSSAGGCPSPIIDGRPISLPIPTEHRSVTSYDSLGLGEIVFHRTRGRIHGGHLCHEDPMFANGSCAFGQTGAAQTHLSRHDVGPGDVFLFFGLFSDEIGREPHHRIFGFLLVSRVISLSTAKWNDSAFPRLHPHTIGTWNANNALYVGSGSTCRDAPDGLRLTASGGPPSLWQVPPWLKRFGLSYHSSMERWLPHNRLKSVARGQEFVADIGQNEPARNWLQATLRLIEG